MCDDIPVFDEQIDCLLLDVAVGYMIEQHGKDTLLAQLYELYDQVFGPGDEEDDDDA